jgi:Helix-turn-helix
MTAELGDWLAELGRSEPLTAAEIGAALVAVLESAEFSGLMIVGAPGRRTQSVPDDPRETADRVYQQRLAELQLIRRRVAGVATARRAAELALSSRQAAGADAAELAALASRLDAAQQREAALAQLSHGMHAQIDVFRTAKETAKARFTAAEATLRIAEAIEAAGGQPEPDLDQRREDLRAAEERLRGLHAPELFAAAVGGEHADQADKERRPAAERPMPPPEPPRPAEPVPGLLELRADPLGSDIRILFAVEPANTVTLLAVLEGPGAVSEHGGRAVVLAGGLLTEIRDGGWPADVAEIALADAGEFLARFFPADGGSIARRAAGLAAVTSPSRLRADLHLTIGEVAARSGLTAGRVAAIERDGLRTARVHEAIALARALGARLDLPTGSGPATG